MGREVGGGFRMGNTCPRLISQEWGMLLDHRPRGALETQESSSITAAAPGGPVCILSCQEVLGAGQPDLGHMLWWVGSIPLKLQTVTRPSSR